MLSELLVDMHVGETKNNQLYLKLTDVRVNKVAFLQESRPALTRQAAHPIRLSIA